MPFLQWHNYDLNCFMNIYSLLRLVTSIRSPRLKLAGIWVFHMLGRRYLGLFIDPVLGCNYRCRMCYFSEPDVRERMHGYMTEDELRGVAKAFFGRALKLQIGCGAEPTIYKNLPKVVALGKEYEIPYISVTTNGVLLTEEKIEQLVNVGLNELTISLHGITKETYEYMMQGGDFDRFLTLVEALKAVKKRHPEFAIRVNYTMNADNTAELVKFWDLFANLSLSVVQIRPIQPLDDHTAYRNFDLRPILALYDHVVIPFVAACREHNVVCIYPEKENLCALVEEVNPSDDFDAYQHYAYCNLRPSYHWRADFDISYDTYDGYARRHGLAAEMLKRIFLRKNRVRQVEATKRMNYKIK